MMPKQIYQNQYKPKHTAITFYFIHIPILIALFVLLAVGAVGLAAKSGKLNGLKAAAGRVLGDTTTGSGSGDDSTTSGSSNTGDSGEQQDTQEVQKPEATDAQKSGNTEGKGKSDTKTINWNNNGNHFGEVRKLSGSAPENEIETDSENKSDTTEPEDFGTGDSAQGSKGNLGKHVTSQTLTNTDGTKTVILREAQGEKVKVTTQTFSVFGNLLQSIQAEQDVNGKGETHIKTFTLSGRQASEIHLKTEDGGLGVNVTPGTGPASRVSFDAVENQLVVKESTEDPTDDVKIKAGKTDFSLEHNSTILTAHFPIVVNSTTGKLFVQTGNGNQVELKDMPDAIVNKAKTFTGISNVTTVSTEETNGALSFDIKGTRDAKLFGVFSVKIPVEATMSGDGNTVTTVNQDFLTRLLNLLSF